MADPGFPVGGRGPRRGDRGLLRRVCFENFVCRNERIWTRRGERAPGTPPRSANGIQYLIQFRGGSRIYRRGGVDSRGSYVSKILYVKMKESGPVGGGACAGHAPSRSANAVCFNIMSLWPHGFRTLVDKKSRTKVVLVQWRRQRKLYSDLRVAGSVWRRVMVIM